MSFIGGNLEASLATKAKTRTPRREYSADAFSVVAPYYSEEYPLRWRNVTSAEDILVSSGTSKIYFNRMGNMMQYYIPEVTIDDILGVGATTDNEICAIFTASATFGYNLLDSSNTIVASTRVSQGAGGFACHVMVNEPAGEIHLTFRILDINTTVALTANTAAIPLAHTGLIPLAP